MICGLVSNAPAKRLPAFVGLTAAAALWLLAPSAAAQQPPPRRQPAPNDTEPVDPWADPAPAPKPPSAPKNMPVEPWPNEPSQPAAPSPRPAPAPQPAAPRPAAAPRPYPPPPYGHPYPQPNGPPPQGYPYPPPYGPQQSYRYPPQGNHPQPGYRYPYPPRGGYPPPGYRYPPPAQGGYPQPGYRYPYPPPGYYPYPRPGSAAPLQDPLPRAVIEEWEPGEPVPDGYYPVSSVNTKLLATSVGTFGGVYLLSVAVGAASGAAEEEESVDGDGVSEEDWAPMYIPVVGPFIAIATVKARDSGIALLVLDGLVQTVSFAGIITSIADRDHRLVRYQYKAGSIELLPILGPSHQGAVLNGTF